MSPEKKGNGLYSWPTLMRPKLPGWLCYCSDKLMDQISGGVFLLAECLYMGTPSDFSYSSGINLE